jgi:hypothetical protein
MVVLDDPSKIKYKHHILFEKLQEGSYFGSRVIIDEVNIKNYVRDNLDFLKDSSKIPNALQYSSNFSYFKISKSKEENDAYKAFKRKRAYLKGADDEGESPNFYDLDEEKEENLLNKDPKYFQKTFSQFQIQ